VLVVLLIDNVVNELSHKKPLERNTYAVLASGELEPAKPEPESSAVAAPAGESILALLASADPATSQKATKLCTTCHTFNEDGKNRVGPNLWGMVGKEKGTVSGFKYSDALGNGGGIWSYEDLDAFLADPKGFLKGTRMSFSGIKSVKKRAAIIAYMRQQSSNPPPLPSQYR
jgi:cytochrome c